MNRFSDFSIKSKLIISVVSLLILALLLFSAFVLIAKYDNKKTNLLEQAKLQANLTSDHAITPLLFDDKLGAQDVLSKLTSVSNIKAAIIYDENMRQYTSYIQNDQKISTPENIRSLRASYEELKGEMVITTPITHNENTFGAIVLYVSTQEVSDELINYAIFLFLLMLVLLALSLLVIFKIQNYITTPIISLARTAQEISLSEDYTIRAQKLYTDEVGRLYDDFNSMLNKIEQRGRERDEAETISRTYQSHLERLTNELEERVKERTIELQESYNNLQNMQAQLIESEKMSALGNLVAGVAHEVNTPLGISITAASIFKNEIKSIKDMLDENRLSKTALLHFIDTIMEADEILIKNLDRAALLVKNFKKISVDQSSEELRDFELNSYLKEVVSTFKSELKHRPIELDLQLEDESINMFSYPGAISQIVVNMLQNALLHAFDFDQEGKIILETHQDDKNATIIFTDNGKGIDSAVVDKVFEPFITTKRNEGGTGLGLNITYNLITQKLAGNIHLDTKYQDGARFVITVPLNITDNEAEAI